MCTFVWPNLTRAHLEPLVHTLGMELVAAGQHAQQLLGLKVTHADHARRLVRLGALRVAVVLVGRELLDVALVEPLLLGLTEALSQRQQGLGTAGCD